MSMRSTKFSKRILNPLFVLLTSVVVWVTPLSATPPCGPDYSGLCRTLGGTWRNTGGKCPTSGSCSVQIPLVDYNCRNDSDCRPCGGEECKPTLKRFSPKAIAILKREPSLDVDGVLRCVHPSNQSCGCVNGRCAVVNGSVECRSDSDCFYCCGSCKPTGWGDVSDCESMCLLNPADSFNCRCHQSRCISANILK